MPIPFQIFSASAGTGKTYRLTRTVIELLLRSDNPLFFSQLLALTFTNKAVEEMKSRVVESLHSFSGADAHGHSMFRDLQTSTGMDEEELRRRSEFILRTLLHNYSQLDIMTIDRFNHRLIQTFAADLGLPPQFEVELTGDALLEDAVFRLIDRSRKDAELRAALLDYVLTSLDETGSWDITRELMRFGGRIFQDWDADRLDRLGEVSTWDLKSLRQELSRLRNEYARRRVQLACDSLNRVEQAGFEPDLHSDYRKLYRDRLTSDTLSPLGEKNFPFTASRDEKIPAGENIFRKKTPGSQSDLLPSLGTQYLDIREAYIGEMRYQAALQALYPTLLLGALHREVRELYAERQVLHISEFNKLIRSVIREQPAPFLYERMGERYLYYFVDEFQDTSELQWQNLVPLVDYGLSHLSETETGAGLFLVGDVKQSIYRWRGGHVGQFISLIREQEAESEQTFDYSPVVSDLDTNFRSGRRLVSFVNDLFAYAIERDAPAVIRDMYRTGVHQKAQRPTEGYVRVTGIDGEAATEEKPGLYALGMKSALDELLALGYRYGDVAVLLRRNEELSSLTRELRRLGVPVSSVRGRRLSEYPGVQFAIHMLRYALDPLKRDAAGECLYWLSREAEDPHRELLEAWADPRSYLSERYGFDPSEPLGRGLSRFLEAVLPLLPEGIRDAQALSQLAERMRDYEKKSGASPLGFLHWWEHKEKDWFVAPAATGEAVNLITIHSSKGLQFPIVFLCFEESMRMRPFFHWLRMPEESPVDTLLFRLTKGLIPLGEDVRRAYEEEVLGTYIDHYNLWYVALTRAENALYLWLPVQAEKDKAVADKESRPRLLPEHLQEWAAAQGKPLQPDGVPAEWGELAAAEAGEAGESTVMTIAHGLDFRYVDPLAYAEEGARTDESSRERGLELHRLLARVRTASDLDAVCDEALSSKTGELWSSLQAVVGHPELKSYFSGAGAVLCEPDIALPGGALLRPDRLVLDGPQARILEYKTGAPQPAHHEQLEGYCRAIEGMGYRVAEAILVYLGDPLLLERISVE